MYIQNAILSFKYQNKCSRKRPLKILLYFVYTQVTQPTTTAIIVPRQMETDWLYLAIMASICCCLPIGICAIIAAVHVRKLLLLRICVYASRFIYRKMFKYKKRLLLLRCKHHFESDLINNMDCNDDFCESYCFRATRLSLFKIDSYFYVYKLYTIFGG